MAKFTSLVDMQEKACTQHASNRLFGVKRDGAYRWMTYAEFAELVDAFRGALAALGVGRGDRVAVIANNRVEWAVAAYATYGLGAFYVPMYEAQLPKDWRYIIEDSEAKVVLVANEAIYEQVRAFTDEIATLEHVLCFDAPPERDYSYHAHLERGRNSPTERVYPEPDEIAGLIYTSGTTGKPKGVVLTHGNFTSNINAVHDVFPLGSSDVSLSFLPWAHSFGQTCELHCMLSLGAGMGLAESVQTLMVNFGEVRPTVLFSVPRIFNRIYDGLQKKMDEEGGLKKALFDRGIAVAQQRRRLEEQGRRSLWLDLQYSFFDKLVFSKIRDRLGGRLKYAFSGGAALAREVAEFIDDVGIVVYEGYGLSETSPIVTCNRPGARKIGSVGPPIPGVRVLILDENNREQPPETDGEVCVIGPNVMKGYWKRPEETAEVIFDYQGERCFRTGDMGRLDRDGFLYITGRIKEQYKLENGKYVVPAPLEEQLKLSGFINQVMIYGMNRPYNVALVVPDREAITKWAREQGIAVDDYEKLLRDPRVHDKIGEEIAKFGADFKGYERPRKWLLLAEEFSPDNDMLTPTLKLKRRNVIKRYQEQIEALYKDD
ncbi:MAG: long-chain fatty acid--CoA ligase [Planctomycetota bacterium]|nr:MAG: long-chain fatty acid--CoA ligase [Planctomycetota bacterium]